MAWLYAASTPGTATTAQGPARAGHIADAIVATAAGWSITTAAAQVPGLASNVGGWAVLTHATSGARIAVVVCMDTLGGGAYVLDASQRYVGPNLGVAAISLAYSRPASPSLAVPAPRDVDAARSGGFLYSVVTTVPTLAPRIHVWAEDTTGAVMVAWQDNTTVAQVDAVWMAGDLVPSPLNPSDTGADARQIQWAGDGVTLADGVIGEGQCLSGAGSRIVGFAPIGSVGLTGTGGTAIYQAPTTFASASTVVADGSVVKGRIDPASVRIGRAVSAGQTTDTQAHVYLRGKIWGRWAPGYGTFVV
jgi:hypothetical protein